VNPVDPANPANPTKNRFFTGVPDLPHDLLHDLPHDRKDS
jgi:hypothetical protein